MPALAVLPDNLTIEVSDITGDDQADHLVLTKRSLRAATYRIFTWDPTTGYTEISAPQVRTYRGYVQEDPDIRVNASIEPGDVLQANLSDGRDAIQRLDNMSVTITGPEGSPDPGSGNVFISRNVNRISPTQNRYIVPKYTMRQMHVGMDLANDYYTAFGSVEATVARAEQRVNDSDHFYARDMGMAWEIQECVVRVGGDPDNWKTWWTSETTAYINTKIKFKAPGGGGSSGVVFDAVDVNHQHTCTVGSTAQYSKSLGHEVAHRFGAGHYSSWDDTMSGSNSALGTGTVQRMIDHSHIAMEVAAPAVIYGADLCPYAMEDGAMTYLDTPVEIDLLENDYDGNGDAVLLEYVDSTTSRGGTVTVVSGGTVRYTPPTGFLGMDEFEYYVSDTGGLTNRNGYVKIYVQNNDIASHYILDEDSGTLVHDIGPYQAHGALESGLKFNGIVGKIGNALEYTSTDDTKRADLYGTGDPMTGDLSVSLWVKYTQIPTTEGVLICKGGAVIPGRFSNPRGGWAIGHTTSGFRFGGNMQRDLWQPTNSEYFDRTSLTSIQLDTWYHLVMVLDRTNHIIRAWINNSEVSNSAWRSYVPNGMIEASHHPLVLLDAQSQTDQGTDTPCILDDVRIYHKVLTDSDISFLYLNSVQEDIPAGAPDPQNSSYIEASQSYTLSWMPGKPSTYNFNVYFGSDFDAVATADTNTPNIYKGNQSTTTYPVTLKSNQEYFWRIDEMRDNTVIAGQVWRFSTNAIGDDYRLDLGTMSSPVETDFIGIVFDQTTWVNGSPFTLTSNTTTVTTQTNGGNGDLLSDYVRANVGGAQLILTFSDIQTGDYTLKFHQWLNDIYDVPLKSWLQVQGNNLRLVDFGSTIKNTLPYTADVTLSSAKTYEFIVQDNNNRNYAYIAGLELIKKNTPPSFINDPVLGETAAESISYLMNLADNVVDPDIGETVTFAKVSGPVWVIVEADGTLGGTPAEVDIGSNVVQVQVTDSEDASDTTDVTIEVVNMYLGDKGFSDFAGLASKWMSDCEGYDYCDGADLSNDGFADLDDLLIFCQNWMN